MEDLMQRFKYAVVPRFVMREKGGLIDVLSIEQQFNDWIRNYTSQGFVVYRNTAIGAVLEPGCLARLLFRRKVEFIDFEAIEFRPSDQAVDYEYRVAPIFVIKAKKLKSGTKNKVNSFDAGLALFEEHREEFEIMINDHINQIAQQGLRYNSSTVIKVSVEPGCFGMLRGKPVEYVDFEAYEFVRTPNKPQYKCRVFPRFKCKKSAFKYDELENYIEDKVQAEMTEGFDLKGKISFDAFLTTGCFGKGERVSVDAFLFEKHEAGISQE